MKNRDYLFVWLAIFGVLILQIEFFLGSIGLHKPEVDVLWTAHLCLILAAFYFGLRFTLLDAFKSKASIFVLIIGLLFWLAAIVPGLCPVISRDALIYHLFVSKHWLATGSFSVIEWHDPSYFPLLLSLGFRGFVQFGVEELSSLYHGIFSVLCACLSYWTLRHIAGISIFYSSLAFTILLSIPIVIRLSGEPMTDLALSFLFGSGLLFSISALTDKEDPKRFCIGASLCFGLALSTKYTVLLAFSLLAPLLLWMALKSGRSLKASIYFSLLIGLGALLVASPWFVRNYFLTGDPIYPFLAELIGETNKRAFVGEISPLMYRMVVYGESITDLLFLPLRVLIFGEDGTTQSFDGLGSILLILGIFSVFSKRLWCLLPILVISIAHLIGAPFLHHLLLRYHVPYLIPGIVFSVLGIEVLWTRHRRVGRFIVISCIMLHTLQSLNYLKETYAHRGVFHYLFSSETKDEYLTQHLGEYALIKEVNAKLKNTDCAYLFYTGSRFFYYERCARSSYDAFESIEEGLSTNFRSYLREKGFTHLALHKMRASQSLIPLFKEKPEVESEWKKFLSEDVKLTSNVNNYLLLELLSKE